MPMSAGDDELLGRYVRQHDQAALDELIRRHIDFVYAAARRQLGGDAHTAEDVTQAVFLILLGKAKSVRRGGLVGWLFQTTRYAAANARKVLERRTGYEREAAAARKEEKMSGQQPALEA